MSSSLPNVDDVQDLDALSLINPVINGIRQMSISTLLLNNSSSLSLHTTDSGYASAEEGMLIPTVFESVKTYEFIGFTAETSAKVWAIWTDVGPDGPWDFEETARNFIKDQAHDASNLDDDWHQVLQNLGLKEDLYAAILDPAYNSLRLTASAKFWAIDSFQLRFRTLKLYQDKSDERAKLLARKRAGTPYTSLGMHSGEHEASEQAGGCTADAQSLRRSIPTTSLSSRAPQSASAAQSSQTGSVQVATATNHPHFTPGFTTLWKGIDGKRIQHLYNEDSGDLDVSRLYSSWPTDFMGVSGPTLYLSLEKEVANLYAKYAKRRGAESAKLLECIIPNSVITSSEPYMLTGDEWKEFVWTCCHSQRMPKHLRKLNSSRLLTGHISQSRTKSIARMESWEELDDSNFMRVSEGGCEINASQYVFKTEEMMDILADTMEVKIWDVL